MRKQPITLLLVCVLLIALPSVPEIRAFLALPLQVSDEQARGDACYVLAGGSAIWERLAAASTLYHMKRVPKIILMNNPERSSYRFTAQASWTQTQWAIDYLHWRGVPKEKIQLLPEAKGFFGTFAEARNFGSLKIKRLVLVTSAPHTRRSLLAFRRTLPSTQVVPYAATSFRSSTEMYSPLFQEYLKLVIYYLFL